VIIIDLGLIFGMNMNAMLSSRLPPFLYKNYEFSILFVFISLAFYQQFSPSFSLRYVKKQTLIKEYWVFWIYLSTTVVLKQRIDVFLLKFEVLVN